MELRIDFWDVGQGDASVITLPDGRLVVIDTGPPGSPLVHWLNSHPEKKLYALVLTHNHEDHVGELSSILECCKGRIEHVFCVQGDHGGDKLEKKILSELVRRAKGKEFSLNRLERPVKAFQSIFSASYDEKLFIYCCAPDAQAAFGNQVSASPDANKVSGIVCLDINGKTEVIWPGDTTMQNMVKYAPEKRPRVLVGPHHGGAQNRNAATFFPTFEKIAPNCVFVSVGSDNQYHHPLREHFIDPHYKLGRRVCCSQLKHCDQSRLLNGRHLLSHHLPLGLWPPSSKKAVTCRGPMTLKRDSANGSWAWDQWHSIHEELAMALDNPLCQGGSETKALRLQLFSKKI